MKFLVLLTLLISSSARAQLRCLDKLLPAGRASASHQLTQAEWRPAGPGPLTIADSSRALSALVFGKLLCREGEIEFERSVSCVAIDETKPEWVTCLANSSLGHFVLTSDLNQDANVIFHKAPRVVDPESEP